MSDLATSYPSAHCYHSSGFTIYKLCDVSLPAHNTGSSLVAMETEAVSKVKVSISCQLQCFLLYHIDKTSFQDAIMIHTSISHILLLILPLLNTGAATVSLSCYFYCLLLSQISLQDTIIFSVIIIIIIIIILSIMCRCR